MMRYIILLVSVFILHSCVGTYGFHGVQTESYTIKAKEKVLLHTESKGKYTFDLSNQSDTDVTLAITTAEGKQVILDKGESVKIENETMDGIQIENRSLENGILRLGVHLQNQKVIMPSAENFQKNRE